MKKLIIKILAPMILRALIKYFSPKIVELLKKGLTNLKEIAVNSENDFDDMLVDTLMEIINSDY